jgi:hypothetical protein
MGDARALGSLLVAYADQIKWNVERGVIQELGACGNVYRQLPVSDALSNDLEASLEELEAVSALR